MANETEIGLPDGQVIVVSHEGELTQDKVKNILGQLGYIKQEEPFSMKDLVLGEGTRISGAMAGAIKGSQRGPWGAAIGGLVGAAAAEPIARGLTEREESTGESVANVGLAAFQPVSRPAALMSRLVRGGAVGAGLGAAHKSLQTAIDEKRMATPGELLPSAGIGAVLGAPLEGVLGPRISNAAPATESKPSITASLDKRKPKSLEQANAEANQIASGGKSDAAKSAQATPLPVTPATTAKPAKPKEFKIPADLAKSKPRYAYGQNQFNLQFDSDLDRALYILAQKNPSKRDADFLKAVMDHTGMTEPEARASGKIIRDRIKSLAESDLEAGSIKVPSIIQPKAPEQAKQAIHKIEKPKKGKTIDIDDEDALEAAAAEQNRVSVDDEDAIEAAAAAQAKERAQKSELEADKEAYASLQADMAKMGHDKSGTPEYNKLWQMSEDIKNRHGGMPPGQVAGGDLDAMAEQVMQQAEGAIKFAESVGLPEAQIKKARDQLASLKKRSKKVAKAPVATESPILEQNAPKAPETPPTTPPEGQVGYEKGGELEKKVRKHTGRLLDSDLIPDPVKAAAKENPEIYYDIHKQGKWKDLAEASTDDELMSLVDDAATADEKVIYLDELSNRLVKAGKTEEAIGIKNEASKLLTPSAQALRASGITRTAVGELLQAEEMVAKAGKSLTQEQKDKLLNLASDAIDAQKKVNIAERTAKEDFSDANIRAYEDAVNELGMANKEFDDFKDAIEPRDFADMAVKMIQGNLLTPMSITSNVAGNMIFSPLQKASMSVASMMDAIFTKSYQAMTKLAGGDPSKIRRAVSATNPLPSVRELDAMAKGLRTASKEILTGPSAESYVKAEVQKGFKPLRSMMDAISGNNLPVNQKGEIAAWDRTKAFIEGTLGVPPEVMFRLLAIGDKPFRRAAEVRALLEQARIKGLEGKKLEQFLMFPDEATKRMVEKEARRAVFSEENRGITTLNRFLDSDIAKMLRVDKIPALAGFLKIAGRLTVPFRQFPVNYALTAMNFAAPPLALSKFAYYSREARQAMFDASLSEGARAARAVEFRRKALTNLGEATMGAMMYTAADVLWRNGLISEAPAANAADRSDQSELMGASKINVDGLERYLNGEDPAYRKGDKTIEWTRLGVPAVIFHIYSDQAVRERSKQAKLGETMDKEAFSAKRWYEADNLFASAPGVGKFIFDQSFLAGTNSLLEAIKEADPESPAFRNWVQNMFRAVTAIAVPNTVEAVARTQFDYVPDLRGESIPATLSKIWEFKTLQMSQEDRDVIYKRDTWGRPIPRTPEGANKYAYNLMDFTKAGAQKANPFDQALYDLFQETNRPTVYPDPVGRTLQIPSMGTVELHPSYYEKLQEYVGTMRRQGMEQFIASPTYLRLEPNERALALERIYERATSAGRAQFLAKSGIMNDVKSDTPLNKLVSRSTKEALINDVK